MRAREAGKTGREATVRARNGSARAGRCDMHRGGRLRGAGMALLFPSLPCPVHPDPHSQSRSNSHPVWRAVSGRAPCQASTGPWTAQAWCLGTDAVRDRHSAPASDTAVRQRTAMPGVAARRTSTAARRHPAEAHLSGDGAGSLAAGTMAGFIVRRASDGSRRSSPIRARWMHPASAIPLPRLPRRRWASESRSAAACPVRGGWSRPLRHRGSG